MSQYSRLPGQAAQESGLRSQHAQSAADRSIRDLYGMLQRDCPTTGEGLGTAK